MSFIDKDQRITSWQTKTKHNFFETSVTCSFLSSFFPSRLELFCSTADVSCVNKYAMGHISVAYFFFSYHQDLFIFLFHRIAVSWLSHSVSVWSLNQHVCRFSSAIVLQPSFWCSGNLQNHPVSLKIYASLLIANSKSLLDITSRRHPT